MADSEDSWFINPQTSHPQPAVGRWLKLAAIATANVLVFAAFASYFDNQAMSIVDVISITADAMGIVLGLLGVVFFV